MNFKFEKNKFVSLTLAGVMLTAMVGCSQPAENPGSTQPGSSSSQSAVKAGPFTDMKTVDLDGNEVDSSIFAENKLTLVNVWNLGCTPCIQEIPHLDKLNKDLAERGVAIKGLYYNFGDELTQQDRDDIAEIFKNADADYQQLLTSEGMMEFKALGQIQAFPTTFFVDSKGNIVDSKMGARDYDEWLEIIESVLEKVEGLMKRVWKRQGPALLLLTLGILSVLYGVQRQEHLTVAKKSNLICLECIGIG